MTYLSFKRIKIIIFNHATIARFRFLCLHTQLIHTCHYVKDQKEKQWNYKSVKKTHKRFLPKNPLVLCHGLMGFDKIEIGKYKYFKSFPFIVLYYWRGIKEVLEANGVEVFITSVPMLGTVEERSYLLHKQIEDKYKGYKVNLIAHSMGGLDCRYLISKINPKKYQVGSLTTIATPHRGTYFANYCLKLINALNISKTCNLFSLMGLQTQVIEELTTTYMENVFNKNVIDDPNVLYFSYGASFVPSFFNIFRLNKINNAEGMNDGLVSVKSSIWGNYKGTLENVNHLRVILA
ncbi:unnamed protein product [Pneumocystis jirovecii]|uniref:DUF676 domain-containing protein n=1 Tax=Pneumocystis jirovecii TaxID=42068 RepID=L0PB87_PNEJI|nr:unnamed protein product [Pneumocystis jirovecii]